MQYQVGEIMVIDVFNEQEVMDGKRSWAIPVLALEYSVKPQCTSDSDIW